MENIGSLIDQVINKIGEWTFDHKVYLSSKISDYDYDPEHPERRFISTYVHMITILDLLGGEVVTVKMESESMYKLITSLIFKSKYNQDGNIVSVGCYENTYNYPCQLSVEGENNKTNIIIKPFTLLDFNVGTTISIQNKFLDALIGMLKMDGGKNLDDYV